MSLQEFEQTSQNGKTGLVRWLRALPFETPTAVPLKMMGSKSVQSSIYALYRRAQIRGVVRTKTIDGVLYVCRYPKSPDAANKKEPTS